MAARLRVMRRVLGNPSLRRVELAFLGFGISEFGVWVAVLVYAYRRGGTTLAAVIAVVQLLPGVVVAPLAAELADRRGAALALRVSYASQAIALIATGALFMLGAAPAVGYVFATLAATAVTLTRPAQGALLPQLVAKPSELTAANATSSWVESVSLLLGPAVAGLVMAIDGPGSAVLAFGVLLLACRGLVAGIPNASGDAAGEREDTAHAASALAVCRANRPVTALLGLGFVQYVAEGSIDVVVVVLAIKQLGIGNGGAGYLTAMFGVGAVLGGAGSVALIGRRRLAGPLLAAACLWGAAYIALAGWRSAVPAFALIAVAGASRTVLDTASRTILHRAVPMAMHGRIFGALEGLAMAGLAVGSLSVPVLVRLGGVGAALAGAGGALVVASGLAVAALRRLDDVVAVPEVAVLLLRRSVLFGMLAAPVLEDLARALVEIPVAAGEAVVREGDRGDRFYLIEAGEFGVTIAGERVRSMGEGDGFGEIALLHAGIRTATVTALTPGTVFALASEPFLEALGGSRHAARAAAELVDSRLASMPAG